LAGIGFVLRRVVADETYSSAFKGYLAAAVVSSGPWFLAVFTLALLGVISSGFLPSEERNLFFSGIVYSFAFSLITVGLLQMPATRMVADYLYVKRLDQAMPGLMGLLLVSMPVQTISMTVVFGLSGTGAVYALTVGLMYASVSGIWLTMIFLSAAKRYAAIVWAFFAGYAASLGTSFVLGSVWGPEAALAGFALGQNLTFILLWHRVLAEFGAPTIINFNAFRYVRKFWTLAAIGFVYNLAIWIDKFMFWFSDAGTQVKGLIHVFTMYDTATFLAFLTSAPAMALFLTNVETSFYFSYKGFYDKLIAKSSWREITEAKQVLWSTMKANYFSLLKLQILIMALGLVFAGDVLDALDLPIAAVFMLRLNILSVGLHVFLSVTILLLLYFDMRGTTLLVLLAFLITNIVATAVTIGLDYRWYGFGFLTAEAVGVVLGLGALVNRFRNLEYLTFSRQPITDPERIRAQLPVKLDRVEPEGAATAGLEENAAEAVTRR